MKKHLPELLALTTIALPLIVRAQPTLNQGNSVPGAGTIISYESNIALTVPTLATSGSSNNWDITGVAPTGTSTLITYGAPSASPYASSYPTATLSAHVTGNGSAPYWDHFQTSTTNAIYLGPDGDPYDDPLIGVTFPFSMGGNQTDTYATAGGSPMNWSATYVAYGQATTPWGIESDLVMFSLNGGASYLFYKASNILRSIGTYIPGALLQFDEVTVISGVDEVADEPLDLWPVPATDIVRISLRTPAPGTLSIMDGAGRTVLSRPIASTPVMLDVRGLASGVYTAIVDQGTDGRSFGRVVVR